MKVKGKTLVLCSSLQQADSVLETIMNSGLGVTAEPVVICENGHRWIEVHYDTPAELIMLGVLLGRRTSLYND